MSYFSRLTDIVTCNLADLLAGEADPQSALREIIHEMEEGVAGAKRSVTTAAASEKRLADEMQEHQTQMSYWIGKARDEVAQGRDDLARHALSRKKEIEDLIAALQQQQAAAASTRAHLATTLRALEARLAEAHRKLQELLSDQVPGEGLDDTSLVAGGDTSHLGGSAAEIALEESRDAEIEAELEALRKELGRGD